MGDEIVAKVLIVYYSRTGNTERAAEELAKLLNADVEKLVDCENRNGAWGYLIGAKHASSEKLTVIEQPRHEPINYDLVVLATPMWVINMAPALRTYIHYYKNDLKRVVFLVTQNGSCNGKIYEEMRNSVGKLPSAVLDIGAKEFKEGTWQYKLKELAVKLRLLLS
jgi:flavodoxin